MFFLSWILKPTDKLWKMIKQGVSKIQETCSHFRQSEIVQNDGTELLFLLLLWVNLQEFHWLDYIVSNGRMIGAWWILIEVLSWHMPGGIDEDHRQSQSGWLLFCPTSRVGISHIWAKCHCYASTFGPVILFLTVSRSLSHKFLFYCPWDPCSVHLFCVTRSL